MPGPTTESLSGEMKLLADKIDTVAERLAARIDAQARELAAFREEMARFRGRTETSFAVLNGVLKWVGTFVAASILTLFFGVLSLTWNASKLDSRVGALEQATAKNTAAIEELTKTIKLTLPSHPSPSSP